MTKKARSRLASSIALRDNDNDPTQTPSPPIAPSDGLRLLDKAEVTRLVGRSFQCLWLWMQAGKFPRALDLHGRPVWRASDIAAWIEALPQRRFKGDRQ
jgi:predicted DNA-binding transcriptional regulator AlpA